MKNDNYAEFTARMAFELGEQLGSKLEACTAVCPEAVAVFLGEVLILPH